MRKICIHLFVERVSSIKFTGGSFLGPRPVNFIEEMGMSRKEIQLVNHVVLILNIPGVAFSGNLPIVRRWGYTRSKNPFRGERSVEAMKLNQVIAIEKGIKGRSL